MILDAIRKWMGRPPGGDGGDGGGTSGDSDEPAMIPCEEALARVYEYLDGELDETPGEDVARHFRICSRCYPHLELERSFREAIQRAAARQSVPPALREQVLALVEETDPTG